MVEHCASRDRPKRVYCRGRGARHTAQKHDFAVTSRVLTVSRPADFESTIARDAGHVTNYLAPTHRAKDGVIARTGLQAGFRFWISVEAAHTVQCGTKQREESRSCQCYQRHVNLLSLLRGVLQRARDPHVVVPLVWMIQPVYSVDSASAASAGLLSFVYRSRSSYIGRSRRL